MTGRVNRRSYVKYAASGIVAAAVVGVAYYYFGYRPKPTVTPTATPTPTPTTTTPTLNPVVKYALDKGIDPEAAKRLDVLSELNEINKTLVDYLNNVKELVPPEELDREEKIRSLQIKVLDGSKGFDGILTDKEVSDEEKNALKYISGYESDIQISYIDFGIGGDVSKYLFLNSSLPDQDFARWATERKLCVHDHKLTDLEISFLYEPEKYGAEILTTYVQEAKSTSDDSFSDLGEELRKIPEVKMARENADTSTVEAVEDIIYLIRKLKDLRTVRKNLNDMLNEGIRDKRKYCTPLQASLWIAYDNDEVNDILILAKEGDYVMKLLTAAWVSATTSRNFTSPRWKDFNEVVDRLNSPVAVSLYTKYNIRYQSEAVNEYVPARMVFERKYDDCDGFATLQAYFLKANGYNAWSVGIDIESIFGHNVCGYKYDEKWWVLDVEGIQRGPFNSLDELGDYYIPGGSIILFDPFDITKPTRNAYSIPHIVYRRRKS